MKSIKVNLDKKYSTSYDICIGVNIADRMALLMAKNQKARRCIIITDSHVHPLYGASVQGCLKDVGFNPQLIEIPAGESAKNIYTVLDVVAKLLEMGADRETFLIALGGGVVGDLVGFIASVFMRSVPYIQIPTTLVGQVDSSVGGKTAIDLPYGKNLLGTFYQPRSVFIDLNFLQTLPEKEFNNGLAEIIKYGLIDDERMFRLLEEDMDAVKQKEAVVLLKIVENCCRIKKSIVEIDEREQGLRRILNFGHTLGHALEAVSDFTLTHGEGVALGMIAAVRMSVKMNHLDAVAAERIEKVIARAGLPDKIPAALHTMEIIDRLRMDKKKKDDVLHFILLKKIGQPFVNSGVSDDLIMEVIEEMKA